MSDKDAPMSHAVNPAEWTWPPRRDEESLAAALGPFGWTCTPEFWRRYYTDAWVFNLANAVEQLTERLAEAEGVLDHGSDPIALPKSRRTVQGIVGRVEP